MKRIKLVSLIIILFSILLLSATSCVRSSYVLTGQFTNPKTGSIETISIPVTQYKYESTNVGSQEDIKIHTMVLGVKIPMTEYTSTGIVGIGDLLPFVIFGISAILTAINWSKGKLLIKLIPMLIATGLCIGLIATIQPDFTTAVTIIDKNFIISGGF